MVNDKNMKNNIGNYNQLATEPLQTISLIDKKLQYCKKNIFLQQLKHLKRRVSAEA